MLIIAPTNEIANIFIFFFFGLIDCFEKKNIYIIDKKIIRYYILQIKRFYTRNNKDKNQFANSKPTYWDNKRIAFEKMIYNKMLYKLTKYL